MKYRSNKLNLFSGQSLRRTDNIPRLRPGHKDILPSAAILGYCPRHTLTHIHTHTTSVSLILPPRSKSRSDKRYGRSRAGDRGKLSEDYGISWTSVDTFCKSILAGVDAPEVLMSRSARFNHFSP